MERRYLTCGELSQSRAEEIITMLHQIWPPDETTDIKTSINSYISKNERHDLILYLENNSVIAHAISFTREINTDEGKMEVLALAGIAVRPEHRGRNLGKEIVLDAFENIKRNKLELSLFQTGVPRFYEKMGGRIISNRFVNSLNNEDPQANPWWDKSVMIYPGTAAFPDGTIDLLGSGY
ncbi:MAG: GNAT family N-acetyltransferase [Spirochaetes bacterium]|jgi:predicted N-acetyltransferase YhbS|nr:GNAT family N-acetyltransferase [Spirochaetota bacterium]